MLNSNFINEFKLTDLMSLQKNQSGHITDGILKARNLPWYACLSVYHKKLYYTLHIHAYVPVFQNHP